MLKYLRSPLARISFGLVMVTISALLLSDMLGLVPDTRKAALNARRVIAESLAVQFSIAIANNHFKSIGETLEFLVRHNEDVISAGLRDNSGKLIAHYGGHDKHWTLQAGDKSTSMQLQVPLNSNKGFWGTVELRFTDLGGNIGGFSFNSRFLVVILVVAASCFVGYVLFLKRTLRELDPSAVIPERVRMALDTLSEGLLIVDQDSLIVFSNEAFARKTGLTPADLVGRQSGSLPWQASHGSSNFSQLPWDEILEGTREVSESDVATISLATGLKQIYSFQVKTSPIRNENEKIRGALITFDDITEIGKKNEELKRTLGKLEQSQREITRQNQELHVLATRDPLTGLLNRRSFFQSFESLFSEARQGRDELACMMVDIDHFKLVNDRFGHSVGDTVIKLLAKVLSDFSRPNDLVGRFGGEEFCVALPGATKAAASKVAERMRIAVQDTQVMEFKNTHSITISIGITDIRHGASSLAELVDQSDKALYEAKETGRNRVMLWPLGGKPVSSDAPILSDVVVEGVVEAEQQNSENEVPLILDAENQDSSSEVEAKEAIRPHQVPVSDRAFLSDRTLLTDRIDQAILRSARYKTQVALLAIEFGTLARISETMGFAVAEKLSIGVTLRIKEVLRSTDTVALTQEEELMFSVNRPGGDEIVVLLTDLKHADTVTIILQRLLAATREPIEAGGTEYYLDASIGVSLYPLDSQDSGSLMSCASGAMSEAKKSQGKNNYQFFSQEVNNRSREQLRLEADLHGALERGELIVFYQPKVDMKTGVIIGMEALLRWDHPHLGMVSPNDFIPIAEQSDLIEKIGDLVVRSVCIQIQDWRNAGYGTLSVSFNLSPFQFRNTSIADEMIQIIKEAKVPPKALEIEITETVVVQNMQNAIDVLNKLSQFGMEISIDDFGVGYSSFTYLKNFPIDKIKIDRSFISDMSRGRTDAALISGIMSMGHSLGLIVVAEGVETEEQLHFLQDLHCDVVQGYIVSKPLPADEMSQLLSNSSHIRRLIRKHGDSLAQKSANSGGASMFGILNEFPTIASSEPEGIRKSNKH